MKRLLLCIALLACLPVFAQDQPRSPKCEFSVYRIGSSNRINAFADGDQLIVTSANLQVVDPSVSYLLRLAATLKSEPKGSFCKPTWQTSTPAALVGLEIKPRGQVHFMPFQQQ